MKTTKAKTTKIHIRYLDTRAGDVTDVVYDAIQDSVDVVYAGLPSCRSFTITETGINKLTSIHRHVRQAPRIRAWVRTTTKRVHVLKDAGITTELIDIVTVASNHMHV